MQFHDSVFGALLKPIGRRWFAATVKRHDGDAYDKLFHSWDHLVTLVFAQLSGVDGLRGLEAMWNAHSHHHYHLGCGKLRRSTLSDTGPTCGSSSRLMGMPVPSRSIRGRTARARHTARSKSPCARSRSTGHTSISSPVNPRAGLYSLQRVNDSSK